MIRREPLRHGERQSGGAALMFVLFVLLGGVILVFIKVFPIYYDGLSVQRVFRELPEDPRVIGGSKNAILTNLERKFQVNQIYNVNVRESVKIKKIRKRGEPSVTHVSLNYFVVVPLITNPPESNLDVIDVEIRLHFRNETTIPDKPN